MDLSYIAQIIVDAYQKAGFSEQYLAEKRSELAGLDKFQSLLFLHKCDESIQIAFAREIGVTVEDLKITINVLSRC